MHFRAIFGRERDLEAGASDALFRFRKRIFVDHLQWKLAVFDDRERDEFDRADTLHCILFSGVEVAGAFRAIRTDQPYLAETVFPTLAQITPYPKRYDAWEVSRFGASTIHPSAPSLTFSLMFLFAQSVGLQSIVAITDPAFERAMRAFGIRTRRYGPPIPIGNDRRGRPLSGVAGEIILAAQSGTRFQKLLTHAHQIEVEDASDVLGRKRISA